jgi:hypothetical protein
MGPLVATSRRHAADDLARENMAFFRYASGQSSATAPGCAIRCGARLDGVFASDQSRGAKIGRILFAGLDHSFWKFHYTLTSEPAPKEMALIGESRSAEIIANVLFPLWLSQDIDIWADYAALPSRLSNRRLETAATRLFGNDPRRTDFLRTVANQQAMLQIYEDFCLQDDSDCAHCPFPEQMRNWV